MMVEQSTALVRKYEHPLSTMDFVAAVPIVLFAGLRALPCWRIVRLLLE